MSTRFAVAWLGLCATFGAAADDDLGRLFFTPEERAALEVSRTAAALPLPSLTVDEISLLPEAPEPAVLPTPALTVNGIVTRSRGPATLWLNGTAQDARSLHVPGMTEPRIRIDRNAIEIVLDATQPAHRVKAGQTLDPTRDEVVEARGIRDTGAP